MSSGLVARLTADMNLAQIQDKLSELGEFRSAPSQHHTMEKGIEVIYVKKSSPQDRLKRLIMSDDMKADAAMPLANLILNACKNIKVDSTDSRYQNIHKALTTGKGDFSSELANLVLQETLNKNSIKDIF